MTRGAVIYRATGLLIWSSNIWRGLKGDPILIVCEWAAAHSLWLLRGLAFCSTVRDSKPFAKPPSGRIRTPPYPFLPTSIQSAPWQKVGPARHVRHPPNIYLYRGRASFLSVLLSLDGPTPMDPRSLQAGAAGLAANGNRGTGCGRGPDLASPSPHVARPFGPSSLDLCPTVRASDLPWGLHAPNICDLVRPPGDLEFETARFVLRHA